MFIFAQRVNTKRVSFVAVATVNDADPASQYLVSHYCVSRTDSPDTLLHPGSTKLNMLWFRHSISFWFLEMFWRIRNVSSNFSYFFSPSVLMFTCNIVQMYLCAPEIVCNSTSLSIVFHIFYAQTKRNRKYVWNGVVNKLQWQFIIRLIFPSARHSNNDSNEKMNLGSGDGRRE